MATWTGGRLPRGDLPRAAQRDAGVIEAWGRGIRRIADARNEAGNPPSIWEVEPSGEGMWLRFLFSDAYRATDTRDRAGTQSATSITTASRVEAQAT